MTQLIIHNEGNASHFIYTGLGKAFQALGHDFKFWDSKQKPAFDVFDEVDPNIFIGQSYNLDRATIKCLLNRRQGIKVLLKVGSWGQVNDDVDTKQYPILLASDKEKEAVKQLADVLPPDSLALFNYVHPKRKDYLMSGWNSIARTHALLLAADTHTYQQSRPEPRLECDIAFVGGYWPYKGQNFDKYMIPLCYPVGKYDIKIFGNQAWPVPQYMGGATEQTVNALFASATICPNISEPHANAFGFEVNERVFKLAASKAFVISDPVASLYEDIFTKDELVVAIGPNDFRALVDYYLKNPEERQKHIDACYETVMAEHTYIHRAKDILRLFKFAE